MSWTSTSRLSRADVDDTWDETQTSHLPPLFIAEGQATPQQRWPLAKICFTRGIGLFGLSAPTASTSSIDKARFEIINCKNVARLISHLAAPTLVTPTILVRMQGSSKPRAEQSLCVVGDVWQAPPVDVRQYLGSAWKVPFAAAAELRRQNRAWARIEADRYARLAEKTQALQDQKRLAAADAAAGAAASSRDGASSDGAAAEKEQQEEEQGAERSPFAAATEIPTGAPEYLGLMFTPPPQLPGLPPMPMPALPTTFNFAVPVPPAPAVVPVPHPPLPVMPGMPPMPPIPPIPGGGGMPPMPGGMPPMIPAMPGGGMPQIPGTTGMAAAAAAAAGTNPLGARCHGGHGGVPRVRTSTTGVAAQAAASAAAQLAAGGVRKKLGGILKLKKERSSLTKMQAATRCQKCNGYGVCKAKKKKADVEVGDRSAVPKTAVEPPRPCLRCAGTGLPEGKCPDWSTRGMALAEAKKKRKAARRKSSSAAAASATAAGGGDDDGGSGDSSSDGASTSASASAASSMKKTKKKKIKKAKTKKKILKKKEKKKSKHFAFVDARTAQAIGIGTSDWPSYKSVATAIDTLDMGLLSSLHGIHRIFVTLQGWSAGDIGSVTLATETKSYLEQSKKIMAAAHRAHAKGHLTPALDGLDFDGTREEITEETITTKTLGGSVGGDIRRAANFIRKGKWKRPTRTAEHFFLAICEIPQLGEKLVAIQALEETAQDQLCTGMKGLCEDLNLLTRIGGAALESPAFGELMVLLRGVANGLNARVHYCTMPTPKPSGPLPIPVREAARLKAAWHACVCMCLQKLAKRLTFLLLLLFVFFFFSFQVEAGCRFACQHHHDDLVTDTQVRCNRRGQHRRCRVDGIIR